MLKSTLPELKHRNFPSLEVQILNPKKAQFKISRIDFLNSISGSRVRQVLACFSLVGLDTESLRTALKAYFDDAR